MDYKAAIERARTPGELVWHYTTLDTLGLILQNNYLLATEVSFQNDIRETSTADAAFREALEALSFDDRYMLFAREALQYLDREDTWQPTLTSVSHELTRNARFILCASDDPDSLYAWRTYAQGGIGCAIGLDPKVQLGVVDPGPNPGPRRVRHWRQVVYQPARVREAAHRGLRNLGEQWLAARDGGRSEQDADEAFAVIVRHLTEVRSDVRSRAKDPAFSDEHEQRVTVETVSYRALLTTSSSMGPRPHVRLVASENGRWGEICERGDTAPKLPIRAVRLGPDAPDSASAGTQWLLLANGYLLDPDYADDDDPDPFTPQTWANSVVIDHSMHPYRSR
jgi:hypothetical protein